MVRQYLSAVRLVIERREKYLAMTPGQNKNLLKVYPLLHELVMWFQNHRDCPEEELLTEGYRIATRERRNMGVLKLSGQPGAKDLLVQEYFKK